jgi:hypothetical protein
LSLKGYDWTAVSKSLLSHEYEGVFRLILVNFILYPNCNWLTGTNEQNSFLGAFAKLRKATISFVMSACLFICKEQLSFQWMISIKFDI